MILLIIITHLAL